MQATLRLQSLPFRSYRTYLIAAIFIIGNIALPQLFHLIPGGGPTWLPIYFFTLVGAYRFGWKPGLLTAVFSPVINALLFGMPAVAFLPVILLKSVLLATVAGYVASRFKKATLPLLLLVVAGYQIPGTFGEWVITGDLTLALQDLRLGLPGMLLQLFGGYLIINRLR